MIITREKDKKIFREGGKYLAQILDQVKSHVHPGVTTGDLDRLAEKLILEIGGTPSFKNYRTHGTKMPYPASLCTSVNDEVVHGIPGKRVLKEGDIVGLDIGMQFKGFFTDMAVTLPVGQVSHDVGELLRAAEQALALGVSEARSGNKTGDIGEAVQTFVEKKGYGVVKELVGHGVGASVHEDPEIPNWGKKNSGIPLKPGMVIAIEPMITMGSPALEVSPDGWVWRTKSGKLSAHFEHTILITTSDPEIITG